MKKEKITTSKGEFLVVDGEFKILHMLNNKMILCIEDFRCKVSKLYKLSEITEKEASEIVSSLVADEQGNKSYVYTLHSLLKSKGITDLTNKYIFKL